ncbi:MAG: hypothetical protein OHK0039_21530 [Bacteroidia bacterium]
MDQIAFTQIFPFGPFLRLAYYRYFSRPVMLIVMLTLVANLGVLTVGWIDPGVSDPPEVPFFVLLALVVLLPSLVYINTRNIYDSYYFLQDALDYRFSDEGFEVAGAYFSLRMAWAGVYQVREYRDWLLIYTSRYTAYHLYRPALEDPSQWEILKSIVRSKPELSQRLRKT